MITRPWAASREAWEDWWDQYQAGEIPEEDAPDIFCDWTNCQKKTDYCIYPIDWADEDLILCVRHLKQYVDEIHDEALEEDAERDQRFAACAINGDC